MRSPELEKWALAEGSIQILWWLLLGLKLAWKKGSFTNSEVSGHDSIGVDYDYGINGPTMELPRQYLVDTLELLRPLCATPGCIGVRHIYSALGKATRNGHIVPDSAPYVSSLWAGYRAGRRDAIAEKEGSSMHFLPAHRFSSAALWFSTLMNEALAQQDFGAMALRRTLGNNRD